MDFLYGLAPEVAAAVIAGLVSVLTGGVVAIVSTIVGPLLTARAQRKASTGEFQRNIANRVLELWIDGDGSLWTTEKTVPDFLRGDRRETVVRSLFVLGEQLRNDDARAACKRLVQAIRADEKAAAAQRSDKPLQDAWGDLVEKTAKVVRG